MAVKRMTRRHFLNLIAGLGGTAVVAACAPKVVEKEVTKKETVLVEQTVKETVVVEAPGEKMVVLTCAHAWEAAFEAHQEKFDNEFMDENPGIFIKRINTPWGDHNQIVPTWAAAGELPDVIYIHGSRAFPWNSEGILISLQDYVDADAKFDVKGIWEEALKLYQYQGKQYNIPYDHGPIILGYNKDLFDAAGLDYPNEDWTWEGEFLQAAKALTKEGKQWGYSGYYGGTFALGNEQGIAVVGPWGGEVFNDDETKLLIDTPEAKSGLQFFADLIHVHKVAPTPAETTAFPAGVWIAGVVGMFALATWGTPQMNEFGAFKYDVAPWPKGPKARKTGSFGSGYGITKDSKHPDEAWTYMSAYLSKEGMEYMWGSSGRGSPARKAAYQSWIDSEISPEHATYYLDALEKYAVTGHPYKTLKAGEVMDVIGRYTGLVQSGDITVDQCVTSIMSEADPLLRS